MRRLGVLFCSIAARGIPAVVTVGVISIMFIVVSGFVVVFAIVMHSMSSSRIETPPPRVAPQPSQGQPEMPVEQPVRNAEPQHTHEPRGTEEPNHIQSPPRSRKDQPPAKPHLDRKPTQPVSEGPRPAVPASGQVDSVPGSLELGDLDMNIIRRYVHRYHGRIRSCYEQQRGAHPTIAGTVMTQFGIEPSGRVVSATAGGLNDAVSNCVVGVIGDIVFPKSSGNIRVRYPFHFVPDDDQDASGPGRGDVASSAGESLLGITRR